MGYAAKVTLIQNHYFSIKSISFWKKLTSEIIESLYICTIPIANIIINIEANGTCARDQKIMIWVHRFIRNCSKSELQSLICFITGATNLPPNTVIKLEYTEQNPDYLRHLSRSLFCHDSTPCFQI